MQGVSISLFIKTNEKSKNKLAEIKHFELYGIREKKYKSLFEKDLKKIKWTKLNYKEPYYFFVPKDFDEETNYGKGFKLTDLLSRYSAGIKTKVDHIAIDMNSKDLSIRVSDIISNKMNFTQIRQKYGLSDRTTWEYKPEEMKEFKKEKVSKYEYRPFDIRFTYYDDKFLSRSRSQVMNNFFNQDNIGLETSRNGDFLFIGKFISDEHFVSDNSFKFPLYLYPDSNSDNSLFDKEERTPNLNPEIVKQIAEKLGLKFTNEKENNKNTFAPIDILDYIYAVLHSPTYREKYKEFLKIDFPRVPYPKDKETFWKLAKLGGGLREIHLLESPAVKKFITKFPIDGNNEVVKVRYEPALPPPAKEGGGGGLVKNGKSSLSKNTVTTLEHRNEGKEKTSPPPYQGGVRGGLTKDMETNSVKKTKDIPNEDVGNEENEGKEPTVPPPFSKEGAGGGPANSTGKVWINETQYFDNVPQTAWEFFIGGYQPAQKWLKDRKERTLNFDDIEHYQKIIAALSETDRIMKEIESVGVE